MAKFKVLKYNEMFLYHVGISLNSSTNPSKNFKFFTEHYILTAKIIGFVTSVAFILKYPSDIRPALSALMVCISDIQGAGMFSSVRIEMSKAKAVQNELQEIVNNGTSNF